MGESRRQVGLFGGSFNPPHLCHAMATLWTLQTTPVEEVWWIPTYRHAFGKDLASFEDRMAMCAKAVGGLGGVRVLAVERELGGESRTIDTVAHLQHLHPGCDFWLVVGTDILAQTQDWKDWAGLMAQVNLVVVGRGGYGDDAQARAGTMPEFSLPAVSSTSIRQACARQQWDASILHQWVSMEVREYIRAHRLYQEVPA